jgi:hypothetical protein
MGIWRWVLSGKPAPDSFILTGLPDTSTSGWDGSSFQTVYLNNMKFTKVESTNYRSHGLENRFDGPDCAEFGCASVTPLFIFK